MEENDIAELKEVGSKVGRWSQLIHYRINLPFEII
jgi:hypothetical protein